MEAHSCVLTLDSSMDESLGSTEFVHFYARSKNLGDSELLAVRRKREVNSEGNVRCWLLFTSTLAISRNLYGYW